MNISIINKIIIYIFIILKLKKKPLNIKYARTYFEYIYIIIKYQIKYLLILKKMIQHFKYLIKHLKYFYLYLKTLECFGLIFIFSAIFLIISGLFSFLYLLTFILFCFIDISLKLLKFDICFSF